jgi:hypothetical protein
MYTAVMYTDVMPTQSTLTGVLQASTSKDQVFQLSERLASREAGLEAAEQKVAGLAAELDTRRRAGDKAEVERQAAQAKWVCWYAAQGSHTGHTADICWCSGTSTSLLGY